MARTGLKNPVQSHLLMVSEGAAHPLLPPHCTPAPEGLRQCATEFALTFSGDPEEMLPSPRRASIRTSRQGSFCLPVMLSITVSSSIRSFTTLLLRS